MYQVQAGKDTWITSGAWRHVAVHFPGQSLSKTSRRDTVKVWLVYLKQAGARSTITHLRYIEPESVGREQDIGQA